MAGFSQLTQLASLEMSFVDKNSFSGDELQLLPPNLTSLTALENRYLISDRSLPRLVARCPKLRNLNLNQNTLTEGAFGVLAGLVDLQELSLQYIDRLEGKEKDLLVLKDLKRLQRVLLPKRTLQFGELTRFLRPQEAPTPEPTLYELRMKGNELMKESNWAEAAPIYKKCTEMAPMDTNVWFFYANICYELWWQQQQQESGEDEDNSYYFYNNYNNNNNYNNTHYTVTPEGLEAIRAYKKAVWAWEGHHWAIKNVYVMCYQLSLLDDCIHYAQLYIHTYATDPTTPEWLHAALAAARALRDQKQFKEALVLLEEAVNTGGHDTPDLLLSLATCMREAYGGGERDDEALRHLSTIRTLHERSIKAVPERIYDEASSLMAEINISHGRDPYTPPPSGNDNISKKMILKSDLCRGTQYRQTRRGYIRAESMHK